MTIHHDKLAYGKLADTKEDVAEERLREMLKKLNGEEEEEISEEKKNEKSGAE